MGQKQDLQKIIQDLETKKFRDGEAKGLMSAIQEEQTKALTPVFQRLAEDITASMAANWEKAIKAIEIKVPEMKSTPVDVKLPEMKFADFPAWPKFPEIKMPEIKIPDIHVPEIKMPDFMTIEGEVGLKGVSKKSPLPVMLMGPDGKPFTMNIPVMGGTGGGKGDFFTILGIQNTVGVVTINPDGNPTYATASGSGGGSTQAIDSSGNVYNQANPMPVTVVSGSAATTGSALVDSSGVQYTGSNPLPVTLVAGASTSTKAQIGNSDGDYSAANPLPVTTVVALDNGDSATAQRVVIAGNSSASVAATQVGTWNIATITTITNSIGANIVDSSGVAYTTSNPFPVTNTDLPKGNGDSATASRVVMAGDSSASVAASQVGTWNIATVTTITNTVGANLMDSGGVGYSGSNPFPVTLISGSISSTRAQIGNSDGDFSVANPLPVNVTGITNSVAATQVDSSGVAYSGSNPMPVTVVAGAATSTKAQIGNSDGDFTAANPLPIFVAGGGANTTAAVLTRQTNPTAVAADYVPFGADDLGRQLTRPIQVRDLIKTAYVTLSTGTEATLLAGVAGAFLDLIYILACNTSTAAQQLDIRAVTAGNILASLYIPANSTVGFNLPVPFPQDATGNNWTVDMADVTNSNILISALFSQEV